jgi:hypothetical protein
MGIKIKVLPLAFMLLASLQLAAQETESEKEEKPKGFQKEALFVGGNFGLAFGNYTLINISPQLGYRFNDYLAAGFGINGQYVGDRLKDFSGRTVYKSSRGVIGLNTFGRVYPFRFLMLQVQPEVNYLFGKDTYYTGSPTGTFKMDAMIEPSLLLGAGAVLQQGRGALIISAMYDVLERDYSPYGRKPVYNIGYNIGLY